jgi:hypothetical protein
MHLTSIFVEKKFKKKTDYVESLNSAKKFHLFAYLFILAPESFTTPNCQIYEGYPDHRYL